MSKKDTAPKHIPRPPPNWWREFKPIHLMVPLVVLAAGLSRQTDVVYLIFCLALVLLTWGFSLIDRR
jgi:hypothetical protein